MMPSMALISITAIGLSVLLLLASTGLFLWQKKQAANAGDADESDASEVDRTESSSTPADGEATDAKATCLAIIVKQQALAEALLEEMKNKPEHKEDEYLLTCWLSFLNIEYELIDKAVDSSALEPYLDGFAFVLDKVDDALEVDGLLKKLYVNKGLLKELVHTVNTVAEEVAAQMSQTATLNVSLERLQNRVLEGANVESELARVREEIAKTCEIQERIRLKIDEMIVDSDGDSDYVDYLRDFLGGTDSSSFLTSMGSELDEQVAELKRVSAQQSQIIIELQNHVKQIKGGQKDKRDKVDFGVSLARIEKTLLDRNKIVKQLETKLASLQTIKHNLRVDIKKRDDIISAKDSVLSQVKDTDTNQVDIKGVFEQEHASMQSMEDLLHQAPLTAESEHYTTQQAQKMSELRLMVSESELYVEMLERDLDNARDLREALEAKLANGDSKEKQQKEAEKLKLDRIEVTNMTLLNEELENEVERLKAQVLEGKAEILNANRMQAQLLLLDEAIEKLRTDYMQLEEKYLRALIG